MMMPGFEVSEIPSWKEGNETWRGLRVRFPDNIASHSKEQDFYFDADLQFIKFVVCRKLLFSDKGNFDFSVESLRKVDDVLEELCDFELDEDNLDSVASMAGCYIFEVARRNYGGKYY